MIDWKKTQQNLNARGHKLTVDGIVGPMTMKALLDTSLQTPVSNEVAKAMLDVINRYEINTENRLASFIAQCAHESGKFKLMSENLNYSASGLRKVFGKYFPTDALANAYARQPQKIANRVYANRMSNGDEKSGDGWRYRGGGYIQLTGKANYTAFAKWANMTVAQAAEYVRTVEGAMLSAIYFWTTHNLNRFADADNILGQTKAINGGLNGIKDRLDLYNRTKALIN